MDSARTSQAAIEPGLRDQLLGAIPSLRAFAFSLTNSWDRTDDLVQDTLTRAWGSLDRFEQGSNLNAWLFTILRNLFYSEHRKRKREVEDPDGSYAGRLRTHSEQPSHLDFEDFRRALAKLNPGQREAILLVGAEGLSYEEAAAVCAVPVGTLKSRVNRARERLSKLLEVEDIHDIGPDQVTQAVLQRSEFESLTI
jgi:RNA polymerase sigma-70 factor (ECF subfamily)